MKIKIMFAWYDLWIGCFWDKVKKRLYICPLPMIAICIDFAKQNKEKVPYLGKLGDIKMIKSHYLKSGTMVVSPDVVDFLRAHL